MTQAQTALYAPIIEELKYWEDSRGSGDEYRRTHDRDCLLCGGDLNADTIFSLWLPLRYSLNAFECPRWSEWKCIEAETLKRRGIPLKAYTPFVADITQNIGEYLPAEEEITRRLSRLFVLGLQRCNVMLLPSRGMNVQRGRAPYYDYMPHFLYDLLSSRDADIGWIRREQLLCFFREGIIDREHILDLAGTGDVRSHLPRAINLPALLGNYISLLRRRERDMSAA